jgi:hypothetical protein
MTMIHQYKFFFSHCKFQAQNCNNSKKKPKPHKYENAAATKKGREKEFVHCLPYPTSQPLSLPQTPPLAAQRHHFSLRPQ